jgi:hypothetical protein
MPEFRGRVVMQLDNNNVQNAVMRSAPSAPRVMYGNYGGQSGMVRTIPAAKLQVRDVVAGTEARPGDAAAAHSSLSASSGALMGPPPAKRARRDHAVQFGVPGGVVPPHAATAFQLSKSPPPGEKAPLSPLSVTATAVAKRFLRHVPLRTPEGQWVVLTLVPESVDEAPVRRPGAKAGPVGPFFNTAAALAEFRQQQAMANRARVPGSAAASAGGAAPSASSSGLAASSAGGQAPAGYAIAHRSNARPRSPRRYVTVNRSRLTTSSARSAPALQQPVRGRRPRGRPRIRPEGSTRPTTRTGRAAEVRARKMAQRAAAAYRSGQAALAGTNDGSAGFGDEGDELDGDGSVSMLHDGEEGDGGDGIMEFDDEAAAQEYGYGDGEGGDGDGDGVMGSADRSGAASEDEDVEDQETEDLRGLASLLQMARQHGHGADGGDGQGDDENMDEGAGAESQ